MRRRRDPFRRQVLGVLRKPPPKCEHDNEKLQTECEVCGGPTKRSTKGGRAPDER